MAPAEPDPLRPPVRDEEPTPVEEPDPSDPCGAVQEHRGAIGADVVEESWDIWGDRTCLDYQTDCDGDYLDFPWAAIEHADPVPDDAPIESLFADYQDPSAVPGPLEPDAFAAATIDALRTCFLLPGLEERPLSVRFIRDEPDGLFGDLTGLTWYVLEFTDEWVGTFGGVLLVPDEPNGSGVLAIHGHGTEARDWPDAYHALEYARAGRVVLSLEMRANRSDEEEADRAYRLLRAGFTLQGVHIYEMLLGQKYLRWRSDVDPERIALLGHSAGSMKGGVTIRMTDGFASFVSDNEIDFSIPDPEHGKPTLNEDMVPWLNPYTEAFRDFSTAALPVLEQEYGYPGGPEPVLRFLEATLD